MLNQSTHSRVANSTASRLRQGPRRHHLCLEQPDDGLGQRVVVGIADAADGWLDPRLDEALGVANAHVLRPLVAMVNEALEGAPVVERLLEGVEHEARMSCPRHPPADDAAREGVDHEGGVDEPLPGRDVGEIRNPEDVRPRRPELTVHPIGGARRGRVGDGGPCLPPARDAAQPHVPHQAFHRAARHRDALAAELPPDLPGSVDPEVRLVYAPDLGVEQGVAPPPRR